MKYKIGDKVRIRDDLKVNNYYGNKNGTFLFIENMKQHKGKVMTIKESYVTRYYMVEDEYNNSWTDEMIEGLAEHIECLSSETRQKLIYIYENLDGLSHTKIRELLREVIEMKTNLEPIKVTLLEKSILECADGFAYEWIARNHDGVLMIFGCKPCKEDWCWLYDGYDGDDSRSYSLHLFSDKFQFIQWEDEEPVHIPTLLKECEVVE